MIPESSSRSHPLRNGLALLSHLGDSVRPLGVTELARKAGMAKSSVHDLLQILIDAGYVECRDARIGYAISPRVMMLFHDLSAHFVRGGALNRLFSGYAERLKCSIYLSRLVSNRVVVVGGWFWNAPSSTLGSCPQITRSSVGKVLVSGLPEERWDEFTPENSAEAEKFLKDLRAARETGVGWNIRESWAGECSLAAAVPTFQAFPCLAVAFVMRSSDFDSRDREALANEVKALAREVHETAPGL